MLSNASRLLGTETRLVSSSATTLALMRKSKGANGKATKASDNVTNETSESAISTEKNGDIELRIYATPGSKKSVITGIDENAVNVSLAARPVDGQANKELVEFMAEVLQLRKTELDFRKGAKSRCKVLVIRSDCLSVADVKNRIEEQISAR